MFSLLLTIENRGARRFVTAESHEPEAVRSKVSEPFALDVQQFGNLARRRDLDNLRSYGTILGKAVFTRHVRSLFHNVLARVPHGDVLHITLSVEEHDLKWIRWERLCCPQSHTEDTSWEFLRLWRLTPFALDVHSNADRRFPLLSRVGLKALVVVADMGDDNDEGLAPFNCAATVAGIRSSLGKDISCHVLACDGRKQLPGADGLPTVDAICECLTREQFAILHVVCHGQHATVKTSLGTRQPDSPAETSLFLYKSGKYRRWIWDDHVERVEAPTFLRRLGQCTSLPHLIVLWSCHSASWEAELAFGGLGQSLVRTLSIPAVIAMTEDVSVELADRMTQDFYQHLLSSGEVDTALGKACAGVAGNSRVLIPALFSRLRGDKLFGTNVELTEAEWLNGLQKLPTLIGKYAPVLMDRFQHIERKLASPLEYLRESARRPQVDHALHRGEMERLARQKGYLDELCKDFLDTSFDAVARNHSVALTDFDGVCPFPGLRAFDRVVNQNIVEDFRPFFCGREELVGTVSSLLQRHGFVAVLGDSGSGKSSLVLAGVLQKLVHETAVVLRPGKTPLETLRAALGELRPRILVVDQFEELFTECTDPHIRNAFLGELLQLRGPCSIAITMRADFLGECAAHDELRTLLNSPGRVLIGPLKGAELRAAVEEQSQKARLEFEPGLLAQIFHDLEHEPGAMSLVQHCLRQLWQYRHGRWLRACRYRADESQLQKDPKHKHVGGIQGVIGRTADEVYNQLLDLFTDADRVLRYLFRQLVRQIDAEDGDLATPRTVRRRQVLTECTPKGGNPDITRQIIHKLASATIVVTVTNLQTKQPEVELAHDSVIRYWNRLRKWLDDASSTAMLVERVRAAAKVYFSNDNRNDLTLGSALPAAITLLEGEPDSLSPMEQAFVVKCRDAARSLEELRTAEAEERAKAAETQVRALQFRMRAWTLGVFLCIALVAAIWAYVAQKNRADEEDRNAHSLTEFTTKLFHTIDPLGLENVGFRSDNERSHAKDTLTMIAKGAESYIALDGGLTSSSLSVRTTLSDAIGNAFRAIGEMQRARPLLEAALKARNDNPSLHGKAALANSYFHLALLEHFSGNYEEADVAYEKAINILKEARDAIPAEGIEVNLATVQFHRAWLMGETNKRQEAASLFKAVEQSRRGLNCSSLEIRQAFLARMIVMTDPSDREIVIREFKAMHKEMSDRRDELLDVLETYYTINNDWKRADEQKDQQAIAAVRERLMGVLTQARKALPDRHPLLAYLLGDIAEFERCHGNVEVGLVLIREAFDLARQAAPTHPAFIDALVRAGEVMVEANRPRDAESFFKEALKWLKAHGNRDDKKVQRIENLLRHLPRDEENP